MTKQRKQGGQMKKVCALIILLLIFIITLSPTTYAAEEKIDTDNSTLYNNQLELSGADTLYSSLPEQTKEILTELNMSSLSYENINSISFSDFFNIIKELVSEKSTTPFKAIFTVLGIMILCSAVEAGNIISSESPLKKSISSSGALCICVSCIIPLSKLIEQCTQVIDGASGFMALYAPIMAGLMVSSSHSITGASYYSVLMGASEIISLISSRLIIPFTHVFLSLSLISSLSPELCVSGLGRAFEKGMKWIMNLSLGIFATILSSQTLISSSMDEVSNRMAKYAVSSFVPLVGGVLSETVNTFSGSLSLLKNGTGVFVIIASACIFLPVLIECVIWKISFYVLGAAAGILGLKNCSATVKSIEAVCSLMTAVLLTTIMIFIISTVIILIIGK